MSVTTAEEADAIIRSTIKDGFALLCDVDELVSRWLESIPTASKLHEVTAIVILERIAKDMQARLEADAKDVLTGQGQIGTVAGMKEILRLNVEAAIALADEKAKTSLVIPP